MSLLQQTIEAIEPQSQKFRKQGEERILNLTIPQLGYLTRRRFLPGHD